RQRTLVARDVIDEIFLGPQVDRPAVDQGASDLGVVQPLHELRRIRALQRTKIDAIADEKWRLHAGSPPQAETLRTPDTRPAERVRADEGERRGRGHFPSPRGHFRMHHLLQRRHGARDDMLRSPAPPSMLEYQTLLIRPWVPPAAPGPGSTRGLVDPAPAQAVGVVRWHPPPRSWLAWLARPMLTVHETDDEPLVFTVRQRWALMPSWEVRDADGH